MHYVFLFAATAAVALAEGASGPVPSLLIMFAITAAGALIACAIAAWLAARLLGLASPRARAIAVTVLCVALLSVSLSVPLYRTPFGREPVANLLGVFG